MELKGELFKVLNRKNMNGYMRVAVSVAAVVAMCVFIFAMSAAPADDSDALSLGVAWRIVSALVPGYDQLSIAEQIHWQELLNHPVRKTAHFLEYALLGGLCFNMLAQIVLVWRRSSSLTASDYSQGASGSVMRKLHSATFAWRYVAASAWAFATLYAATDEVHQLFVPGRSGMVTDVVLDSTGALTGVLLCWLLYSKVIAVIAKRSDGI